MSAELLRRAAKELREHAEEATPGPWQHVDHGKDGDFMGCGSVITWGEGVEGGDIAAPSGDLYPRGGYSPRQDMAYIALMSPPVGLALAAWLDETAVQIASYAEHFTEGVERFGDLTEVDEAALKVARAILHEAAS